MARIKQNQHHEELRMRILNVAAKNFLRQGYTATTIKQISSETHLSTGSVTNIYPSKEDILCDLVNFVLTQQFSVAEELLSGVTDDNLLIYAMETTLQLYIVEMDDNLREVYSTAYSLPKTSAIIQKMATAKWENLFKEYLPQYETKDFYKLEIASGGVMRGFMTIRCDMWFTMDQKIETFLQCALKLYDIPAERINEIVTFINNYDFKTIAEKTIAKIMQYLDELPD